MGPAVFRLALVARPCRLPKGKRQTMPGAWPRSTRRSNASTCWTRLISMVAAATSCSSAKRWRAAATKYCCPVKFGGLRSPDGAFVGLDARPASVKNFLTYTLTRLGVDHVDVYRPARLDPQVPIEDTIGAVSDLVKAGYVRQIGLSEVGPQTVRRAHTVHPI